MAVLTLTVDPDGSVHVKQYGEFNDIKEAYIAVGQHVAKMLNEHKHCPFAPDHVPRKTGTRKCR